MWWAETVRYIGGQSGRFTIHNISLYSPLARIALDQNPNYPPILSLPDRKSSCSSRSLQFPRSLSRENPSPKSHAMGSKSRSDHPHSGDGASPGFVSLCVCVCVCLGLVGFQRKLWGKEKRKGRFWIRWVSCMVSVVSCVSFRFDLFCVILKFCYLLFCETQKDFYLWIAQRNQLC